jgi:betaine-aldehyde dehydrogenase
MNGEMEGPTLPAHLDLYYGGSWHKPADCRYDETFSPATGKPIIKVAVAGEKDVDAAVKTAQEAFLIWKMVPGTERARLLRKAADVLRTNAVELARLDSWNTGNPLSKMLRDAEIAAIQLDFFAGLIPMIRGETIPQDEGDTFHYTVREPLGVVARIIAYNHPVQFAGAKIAAPLAAGNTVIIKTPDQAPLACLRMAELLTDVFPPGVINILPGKAECGRSLSVHPLVKMVTLIGSAATGKLIQQAVAGALKPTILELGGKNPLIAFPDVDIEKLAAGVVRGMNFTWAGQSCISTSRVYLHESHHDVVLEKVKGILQRDYRPGVPFEPTTTMGPVISKEHHERVLGYIESAKQEGARLVTGGKIPKLDKSLDGGYWIEPTVFADVGPDFRIAREEIFGPVVSVLKWKDEKELLKQVNDTPYGLSASVWTKDIVRATRIVRQINAGWIWVNQTSKHFFGVPFGGLKDSGYGKEECLEELLAHTEIKAVNILLGDTY